MKKPRRVCRGFCSVLLFLSLFGCSLFLLPHGELTCPGESGLYPEAWQNPTIENVPDGENAGKDQK